MSEKRHYEKTERLHWSPAHQVLSDMRFTDTFFLSVHPDTLTWWERRPACEACNNRYYDDHSNDPEFWAWRCGAVPSEGPGKARTLGAYPINARAANGKCGPAATLWKPVTKKESAK
jgi:hypothetical protein